MAATQTIRPAVWQKIVVFDIAIAVTVAAVLLWRARGAAAVTFGVMLFAAYSLVAVVEVLTTKVVLGADHLTYVSRFRRRTIPRAQMEAVTWHARGGVALQLTDGTSVRLPEVGHGSQGVTNIVRAWLSRTADVGAETTDRESGTEVAPRQ